MHCSKTSSIIHKKNSACALNAAWIRQPSQLARRKTALVAAQNLPACL